MEKTPISRCPIEKHGKTPKNIFRSAMRTVDDREEREKGLS
jgi:hypothetical protein